MNTLGKSQTRQSTTNRINHTSFLTLFTINMVHRYPDIRTRQTVSDDEVRSLVEFCLQIVPLIDRVWSQNSMRERVSYNTFLTLVSLNLVHRFPEITNLQNVTEEDVEGIAEFCLRDVPLIHTIWTQGASDQRRINQEERRVA